MLRLGQLEHLGCCGARTENIRVVLLFLRVLSDVFLGFEQLTRVETYGLELRLQVFLHPKRNESVHLVIMEGLSLLAHPIR